MTLPLTALTVQQPWAWAIAEGHKTVENRTWRTRFRGPLAIHASARDERGGWIVIRKRVEGLGIEVPHEDDPTRVVRGAIVATCSVVDCVRAEEVKGPAALWAVPGMWCWVLADVVRLAEPVRARGALGLWRTHQQWDRGMGASAAEVTRGGMVVVTRKKLPEF